MIEITRKETVFEFDNKHWKSITKPRERCHIYGFILSHTYSKILDDLKKANLLRENEKKICCYCWCVLYDQNNVISIISHPNEKCFESFCVEISNCSRFNVVRKWSIRRQINLRDELTIKYMEEITKIGEKLGCNEKIYIL